MEKRICSACGKNCYSADCSRPWVCDMCGAILPVPAPEDGTGEPPEEEVEENN